ncbi:MAG: DUF1499 domain-containing protein [Deltaproteobacteria bacterium]|jgi:uncharacterized protein (DUF1499 family)|nr:DUF1499 domain-containing protein [Deltaproteobacteria bacterium]MBW2383962.1 DUF1499 domain-containing protein [Deltaproteobacteria bacterium]MBW2697687.1 DUF1499 domain-containing protein [Deltaproteobacteria bacterium]
MPDSRSKTALGAYALTALGTAAAVVGIGAIQIGVLRPLVGFYLFAFGTLLCGAFGLLLGSIAILRTRRMHGPDDQRRAVIATLVAIGLLAVVITAALGGGDAPPINDITTDLDSPPSFASSADVPAYAGRDMAYPKEFVEIVRSEYPDLAPIESTLTEADAYARALAAARGLGWEITYEDPATGTFDASETTAIFRFVDDVTVRISSDGRRTHIDMRSKSRDGRGDLGANAARIRRFAAQLELPDVASD